MAQAIAAQLRAMGHEPVLAPLLTPQFVDGPEPDFDGVQAILATSANGIRALVAAHARGATCRLCRGAADQRRKRARPDFADVRNADGDARRWRRPRPRWATPDKGALLHVCGEEAPGTLAR